MLSRASPDELIFGVYCKVPKDEKYRRQKPEDTKKAGEAARNDGVGLASQTQFLKLS
jgi:hypothetical protein